MLKIILMWLCFTPVPFLNGILREKWYKKKIGELKSNIVGAIILSSFFLLYTYLFFKNEIIYFSTGKLFLMGAVWLIMTLIFEFGMGIISGRSLRYMLADYNIFKGRLWPLFLLVVLFSPLLIRFLM